MELLEELESPTSEYKSLMLPITPQKHITYKYTDKDLHLIYKHLQSANSISATTLLITCEFVSTLVWASIAKQHTLPQFNIPIECVYSTTVYLGEV